MGEGLIGLIIILIVLNLAGRILRALTSKQTLAGPKRTFKVPPIKHPYEEKPHQAGPERQAKPITDLMDALRKEFSPIEATIDTLEHEGGETPGDLSEWSEDIFEKSKETSPLMQESAGELVVEEKEIVAETIREIKAREVTPVETAVPRQKRWSADEPVQDILSDVTSVRRAVVLSLILGPCRARRRHR